MGRRRRIRVIAGVLIVGLFSFLLTGCTTFDNFKEAFVEKEAKSKNTIKIGVFEPMSGSDKKMGELEVQGIELANELYPEVLGQKIELVYADNKSDIDTAETVMADLMKKQPLAVLGSYGSIYSLVANAHLEAAETPGIAITNVNPLVTKNHPYYYRVCFVDSYQGVAMARYVYEELRQKKTGILLPEEDDQAIAMASSFKDKFVELTGDEEAIAVYQKFKTGDKDFSGQLEQIRKSNVRTVFVAGEVTDAAKILRQARKMNLNQVVFLGDSDWATDEFMEDAGRFISGNVAFTTLYTEGETVTEMSQKFLEAYNKKYGEEESPQPAVALGFDAYLIARQAIQSAGAGCSGRDVWETLAATKNFEGASGKITFDNVGDPKKSVVINTIKNKTVIPVCTIDPDEPEKKLHKKQKKKEEKQNNGTEN